MASFILNLDTTAPIVNIYAPSYTIRGIDNEIEVVANEELALYQEIYIVDSLGERHDVIFSHQTDRFLGVVNFEGYPVGSAELYATVKDTVHNISQQVYKVITLLSDNDAIRLKVSISDKCRDVSILDKVRETIVTDYEGSLILNISDYDPTV